MQVHCKIVYETADGNSYTHNEYLAVRDKRNQALSNPNSAQIENTYRRALAKGVSTLTGYGISLWMNEDLRELMTETRMNGDIPKEGEITVDQNVKLDKLMRDRYTEKSDKQRIKEAKDNGWKVNGIVMTEIVAQHLIEDVEIGRKNNMKAPKKTITELKVVITNDENLDSKQKEKVLTWLEEDRTNGEILALMQKLKIEYEGDK